MPISDLLTLPPKRGPVAARLRRQDGQAMVEFALILPLFVTLIFLVVEFGITFNNYLRVTDTARVAARAAAVARFDGNTSCGAAQAAAVQAADGLDTAKLSVSCDSTGTPGDPFSVTVTYPWKVSLPLIPWSGGGDLESTATERLE